MADAKSKATDLAQSEPVPLRSRRPYRRIQLLACPAAMKLNRMAAPGGGRGAPLSGGQLTVTVSVSVSYDLSDLKLDDLTSGRAFLKRARTYYLSCLFDAIWCLAGWPPRT